MRATHLETGPSSGFPTVMVRRYSGAGSPHGLHLCSLGCAVGHVCDLVDGSPPQDIVDGIVDGLSYKLIADRHEIAIDTVRMNVKKVYRKLSINSKSELFKMMGTIR